MRNPENLTEEQIASPYATDLPEESNYIDLPTDTEAGREIVKALIEAKSERLELKYLRWNWFSMGAVKEIKDWDKVFKTHKFRLTVSKNDSGKCTCEIYDNAPVCEHCKSYPRPSGNEADFVTNSPAEAPKRENVLDREATETTAQKNGDLNENVCTCGFDADGWREITRTDEKALASDEVSDALEINWRVLGYNCGYLASDPVHRCRKFRTHRHKTDCPHVKKTGKSEHEGDAHVKETGICEHEETIKGTPTLCPSCKNNIAINGGNCLLCKPAREPFSLESLDISKYLTKIGHSDYTHQEWENNTFSALHYSAEKINQLVERINSMEAR